MTDLTPPEWRETATRVPEGMRSFRWPWRGLRCIGCRRIYGARAEYCEACADRALHAALRKLAERDEE